MLKALALKELRELAPIAAIALCAYAAVVARAAGVEFFLFNFFPHGYNEIPFVTDGFTGQMVLISVCFAVALAIKQTVGESWRATWQWLLHRPLSRAEIVVVKLAAGLGIYLLCGALPIVWYACWAAMPGTHPSPFSWSMTAETCEAWLIAGTLYLAAFWCGLWPARSVGPRWAPVIGTGAALSFGYAVLSPVTVVGVWLMPCVLGALIVSNILSVICTRDFS